MRFGAETPQKKSQANAPFGTDGLEVIKPPGMVVTRFPGKDADC